MTATVNADSVLLVLATVADTVELASTLALVLLTIVAITSEVNVLIVAAAAFLVLVTVAATVAVLDNSA